MILHGVESRDDADEDCIGRYGVFRSHLFALLGRWSEILAVDAIRNDVKLPLHARLRDFCRRSLRIADHCVDVTYESELQTVQQPRGETILVAFHRGAAHTPDNGFAGEPRASESEQVFER